jgi:hypothetical protein
MKVSAKENLNVVKCFTDIAKVLHSGKPTTKGEKGKGKGEAGQLKKTDLKPKEAYINNDDEG